MDRKELLAKLKEENERNEPYEAEISRMGWKWGAIATIIVTIAVILLESILWARYNFGTILVATSLGATKFIIGAIKLKSKENIFYAVIYSITFLISAAMYIFALYYGWF